jgi:hypothetical protein
MIWFTMLSNLLLSMLLEKSINPELIVIWRVFGSILKQKLEPLLRKENKEIRWRDITYDIYSY